MNGINYRVRFKEARFVRLVEPIIGEDDYGHVIGIPKGMNVFIGVVPTLNQELSCSDETSLAEKLNEYISFDEGVCT